MFLVTVKFGPGNLAQPKVFGAESIEAAMAGVKHLYKDEEVEWEQFMKRDAAGRVTDTPLEGHWHGRAPGFKNAYIKPLKML